MDCVACGKPISITAKFCGKCGAPVKRLEANSSEAPATEPTPAAVSAPLEQATAPETAASMHAAETVDDLVLTMELPKDVDHASMLKIDLNLPSESHHEPAQVEGLEATAAPPAVPHEAPSPVASAQTLAHWHADQSDIKQMLEKQSHLLDFISLASQQQAHVQSQPSPLEPLLKEVIAQQSNLSAKLAAIQESVAKPQTEVTVRMPEEFKLMLEKQKIELLKAFNQNVAQNTANIETVYKDTAAKIESLLQANTATAQALEKNMAPITQTVTDMKTRLQAVSKKIDDASTQSKKAATGNSSDGTEGSGGFILFIIGLLCGLTMVLSSLAIYNFLSHEASSTSKTAHDDPAADHAKSVAHEDPAHSAAPAAHEPASHDKPAADGGKAKSH